MTDAGGSSTRVLPIRGMTCGGCAATLQRGLERLDGVEQASVSFATRAASVTSTLDEAALQEAVAALGFEALPSEQALQLDDGHEADAARRRAVTAVALALVVLAAGLLPRDPPADGRPPTRAVADALAGLAALALWLGPGRGLLVAAWRRARTLHASMDTLVSLGSGAALAQGAVQLAEGQPAVGAFRAATLIVTFVLIGRSLEERARARAGAGLRALTERLPRRARVLREGLELDVDATDVAEGEVCLVGEGQAVPVDGVVVQGGSGFDESLLTGEPLPVWRGEGDGVVAGSTNAGGALVRVRATAVGGESTAARMVADVARAQASRPPVQRLADRVSAVFVPLVALLALLVWAFGPGGMAAVAVLVAACPCALGLATPTAVQVATARAAALGVLVRDAAALEAAGRADVLLLDKTGTLTRGEPVVEDLHVAGRAPPGGWAPRAVDEAGGDRAGGHAPADTAPGGGHDAVIGTDAPGAARARPNAVPSHDASGRLVGAGASSTWQAFLSGAADDGQADAWVDEALAAAAAVERAASHPFAAALRGVVRQRGLDEPDVDERSLRAGGGGVRGRLTDGREVLVGTPAFLGLEDVPWRGEAAAVERFAARGWSLVLVALDGELRLVLGLGDQLRPTSPRAVRVLRKAGVRCVLSTGDHEAAARAVASLVGIDELYAGETPGDKADRVRQLREAGHVVAMVGDGTNDAPALAAADAGLAVGDATDLARLAAPLVLVRGDLARACAAMELARATLTTIRQNLGLAFAYNVVALPLAASGVLEPPFAAAAMSASSLLVVGNALRLHRWRPSLETAFGLES